MEGKGIVEANFRIFYLRGKEKGEGNSFDRKDYQITQQACRARARGTPDRSQDGIPRTNPDHTGQPPPVPFHLCHGHKNLELGLETLRECPGFIHADDLFKQEYLQRSRGLVFEGFHDCFVPLSSLFLASVRQL